MALTTQIALAQYEATSQRLRLAQPLFWKRPGQGEVVERGELPLNGTDSFVTRRWRKMNSNL
jgi:hypothetical protein